MKREAEILRVVVLLAFAAACFTLAALAGGCEETLPLSEGLLSHP